jgi:CDP-glycerol glycerophosphotransferase (TagB/SpsB family)
VTARGKRTASLLRLLDYVVPKRNMAVLASMPDFEDSTRNLVRGLTQRGIPCTILMENAAEGGADDRGVTCVAKTSIKGLWAFLRARYAFHTHGLFGSYRPPSKKIVVNVWHGMPIKGIGFLLSDTASPVLASFAIATSTLYRDIIANAFGMPQERVLVTGIPRNDTLFARDPQALRRAGWPDDGRKRKLIVWLPTFRQSARLARHDGTDYGSVFGLPEAAAETIDEFCTNHDILCIVKPHPQSDHAGKTYDGKCLKVISEDTLREKQLTLYQLLALSDALITDISSVYIDYLLVNRPIIFSFPDIDEYAKSRTVLLQPLSDWLAGPVVADMRGLFTEMGKVASGTDEHAQRRQTLIGRIHQHQDGRATERLLTEVLSA